ncbi:MAG: hypothetical protein NC489_36715 [Ruminococcus flavefaciens]|nr:hypothetical protein [Ruminococcus flavefaciens]
MLEWKEVKGYDKNIDYNYQKDKANLPELNEEILIQFLNETRPDRPCFVGYFMEKPIYDLVGGVWIIVSADGGSLYEVQNGIKWARFNRP